MIFIVHKLLLTFILLLVYNLYMDELTGFMAYDCGGNEIAREALNVVVGHKTYATNWSLIDKTHIHSLDLYWHGIKKVSYDKSKDTVLEWIFYHTGCVSIGTDFRIISRTIGIINDNEKITSTVKEDSGELTTKKERRV